MMPFPTQNSTLMGFNFVFVKYYNMIRLCQTKCNWRMYYRKQKYWKAIAIHWREASGEQQHWWLIHWGC